MTTAAIIDVAHAGISARGVARSFGAVHALRDATLDVPPGRVTGLIGPNGSGKTTLLLVLASLLTPDAGTVRIGGHDPADNPRGVRRAMGWMPDSLGSWPTLTVRRTLREVGALYGMPREAADARAAELLREVGLEPLADQPTRVLSRGQKQKLSMARALMHHPSVLLLDEPASGLDPAARVDLRHTVRRLSDQGAAVLISSHVLAELDEMVDDAVFLEAGVTASPERIERARAAARPWRIRSLDPGGLAGALVAVGVPAESIGIDRSGVIVPISGDAAASALLQQLVQAAVPVLEFSPATGDLEQTFLDLNRADADVISGPPPGANPAAEGTAR